MANRSRLCVRHAGGRRSGWHLPMTRDRRTRWLFRGWRRLAALLAGLAGAAGSELRRMARRHEVVPHRADRGTGRRPERAGLAVLKQAYAQALGIPVEIFVARDYAALIDAQATARVDYAIYSTTAYATAALLCACVEPVAAPVGEDGATGIKAILVTRDGRLSKPADISTHRVAIARSGQHCRLRAAAARPGRRAGRVDRIGAVPRARRQAPPQRRRCWSMDRSMRFSAGCRPMPTPTVLGRHVGAAGRCGHGRGFAVGGVEIAAAQIRPARLALRARRRAATTLVAS